LNNRLIAQRLRESAAVKERVAAESADVIERIGRTLVDALRARRKLIFFGNGGSAADAQHLAAEFTGHFVRERAPVAALALSTDSSALTAIGNDYGFEHVFERQIAALGRKGDVAVAISTSGNSSNVLRAVKTALSMGITVIAFTGRGGGKLAEQADIALVIPSELTARIQECHITVGHILCEYVDEELIGPAKD
jgi:D-sedoheptulose 7-phosphate isomerase